MKHVTRFVTKILFTKNKAVCNSLSTDNQKGQVIIMEQLKTILEEIRPDLDFEKETSLIDGGILDSFDIISIVGELNTAFDIEINVEDLLPENFNSMTAMQELITKLQQ